MNEIKIEVEMIGPAKDIALIRIQGHIDTYTSNRFGKVMEELISNNHFKIIIDLEKVDYISSAGWGICVGEIRNVQNNKGDIKLTGMTPEVEEVYKLLEFHTIIRAYDTVDDAGKDFK